MKLDDILVERFTNRDEFSWNRSLKFEKQLRGLREFLRKYPINSLVTIYKNAVNDKRFDREDLHRVNNFMRQHNWNPEAIELMS